MFPRGLKTNIAVNLLTVLLLAMVLVGLVVILTFQRGLLRSEMSKTDFYISTIGHYVSQSREAHDGRLGPEYRSALDSMAYASGIPCVLVIDAERKQMYAFDNRCTLAGELASLAGETIEAGERTDTFAGSTWGALGKESRYLIVCAPLLQEGAIVGAAGVVLDLEGIHSTVQDIGRILLLYILFNAVILTLSGVYWLSKVVVEPLRGLVRRAEEYREDDEFAFAHEQRDDEFNRLSKAFNRIMEGISGDKRKLQEMVGSLEKANLGLKQAQEHTIRAEKLASVGRLSAGIAHEIGNPIGIVSGYLELLQQEDITGEDRDDYIGRTQKEIDRINTIIRQLLDLSRPSDGVPKIVSVHEIIGEVAEVTNMQPLMSDISLELDLHAEKDRVRADSDQLRQVFLNVMINAADAVSSMEKGTRGTIAVASEVAGGIAADAPNDSPKGPMLVITYTDNGPGIPEEHIGNIFDPFYTTKEPGKGTGLGLSVSFMIIEGIGGKIEASSANGSGTTLRIHLPLWLEEGGYDGSSSI